MKFSFKKFLSNANILVILILVYVVFTTIFQFSADPNIEVTKLIRAIDSLMSLFMLIYFIVQLIRAPDKKKFMRWGWLILIAALPPVWIIKDIWKYFQILRFLILIQFFYSGKQNTKNKATNNLINTMMLAFLLVLISIILVLHFENVPEANIKTAGEAVYWAVVTISTVGYGDFYPVTTPGRIVTCFLIFSGVSIFVSAAGYFSSWITNINQRFKEDPEDEDSNLSDMD